VGLEKIDHIVVLMLENRSFDHMLGHLRLDGREEVDGLTGGEKNALDDEEFSVFPLPGTTFRADPHHSMEQVALQLEGINGGFVRSFADVAKQKGVSPGEIMGYHPARNLPTYDRLAREYAVCHRWFASVPGPTWPNRFFSYCGHSGGITRNLQLLDAPTIFEHVERAGHSVRYYSHDIAFLRTVRRYTAAREPFRKVADFYASCQRGELPDLAWIDPRFTLGEGPFGTTFTNDDHPPADVARGQALVARVYNALLFAPRDLFSKTLLIVTYDEHGGFYDHFPPPGAPPPHGDTRFARYGVRVPALVISPWVPRGYVSSEVFDHTSIIRTIRNRFCPDMKYGAMGARVDAANDLATLLQLQSPRKAAELPVAPAIAVDEQSDVPPSLSAYQHTELQREMAELRRIALAEGAPADVL